MACAKDSLILHRQRYNQGAVRSGKVYYKPARTRLQPWPGGCVKKYWCELRRESSYHPRQLALVEIPKCSQEEAETIPLENVFKVTLMEELAKGKSLFQIMTSNGKFTLGTDSLEESEKWICTLNKELFGPPKWNVVYEYRVKVLKNYQGDMSYGSYLLKVYNDEIKLFTPNGLIPTKFKCVLGDIYRVKHHIFGELHDCVTISIKNAVTNNKEIDILILNTKSASDVEKVITYRKRHLGPQNELDDKMISDNESSVVVKNVDELQLKLQRVSITSDTDFAASNPLPLAHQQVSHNNSPREEILNTDTVDNSDNASEPAESRRIRSLPRIYVVTVNPSLDDEDGEIWNDSFDLRAPKRKKKLRIKETKTLPLSHGMPSTQALEHVEISEQDNNPDINETSSPSDGQLQTTLIYESVYHTIPRLKDANAILSGHKTMESQNQGYDKLDDDDDDDDDYEEDEEDSDIDVDSGLAASSEMTTANLAAKFSRKPGNWECDVCFVSNEKDISQCIACANTNPNITMPKSSTDISSTTTTATTTISSSFGSGFKLSVNLPTAQLSQPANTVAGFKLGNQSSGGIKLSSLIAGATNSNTASSSSGSIFKLPVSLPTAQASEPTTTAGELKLDCQSSGGFKLGGLNITSFPSKQPAAVTVQSSDECVVTGELKPSEEEIELAQNFMLPPMFYNYKTKPPCPGCIGCEDDSDVPATSDVDTIPSVATSTSATGSMLFGTSGGKLKSFGMPSGLASTSATTTPVLFGASDSGLQSFASLANATEFQFGGEANKKGFAGAGTMLFQSQKEDSEENINPETELDVDFKPLVSLPDTYQVTTGQESEEQLFCERAKLYRYDPNSKQWKERGIGNMTIMKNRESGKSRLVMRREQVLKLCCNHVILPTMQLNPMVGGGNAWRWFTPCDFSEEESKPEQLAIRFKHKEQADSFQEVFLRCIQEGAEDATNKDDFNSAHTEEQQFSADIKFYQFQMDNKLWERKGDGKVVIIKMSSGSQIMRVVDTSDCVFYEQVLSSTCKLGQFPSEEKSWTWRYTRSNSIEVTRYAIRFIELSDCNQFKQLVSDYVVTIVPPHTPRSPEIPPLSPASSDGSSPCQRRPLIEAIKSIGIWSCNNCNTNNPGSESQCMVCDAEKSTPPLLSPTGMQSNNPFFSGGKPVDYNVSSLTSSILSLSNSTAGSDVRSYTPFSNIGLLQRQQGDSESDGPPSLVSVPSQESSSVVSFEQKHEVTKPLFKMPTFTISETKVSFPLLDSTRSDNFSSINSTQSDKEEEHPETEANIFFDPVVSLPSDFDNKSGEENEECVFIHRAKLYRFNNEVKMWKERGIGNIKILKHKTSGKGRILMRREQVLKLCCNHYIVSDMTLKPGSSPDRSWMWFTSADYSEEVAQPEMLCVKFKDPEIASTFKKIFYTFATNTENLDVSPKPSEDDVVCIGEELPEQEFINLAQQYILPRTFYNYLKKRPCPGCRGCIDEEMEYDVVPSNINILHTVTVPEVKQDNVLLFSSGSETVSFADLASAAKSTGGFGGSGLGSSENKGFAGAGKPLFSSQTEKENDTLESFESTAEFKPIVKLSSDVNLQSGEEDEIVLFSHRAKLYRFDPSVKQWKERGTGDIKILKHKKTGKCRILMRRDQILKLCCNHWIAKGMTLTVRDEKVLQWMTLSDFSDEEARAEHFSVRFKLADTAKNFQQIFNDCLSNVDSPEGISLNIQQSFTTESTLQATNSSCNPPNTVNIRVTSSYDSTATSTVTTVEEHAGVNSCSAAMAAALIFPSVTTGSALSATLPTVNSNVTSSYDTTTTFTVNTVKEHPSITSVSAAMTTAGIFPSVNTSSAIQSTADNSAITSITTFTVNTIKEQLSVTTSSATVTTSLIFPSVTTSSAIQPTVDNNVTTSCDAITTFTVNTIKEQPSVTSISTAMTAALSATNSSAMHSTVNSIVTSSYDTTTTFTVNTVKGSSAAMKTAEIFPSATTSSAIQPTVDSSVIASTTAFTVNTIKEQPSVTTSDAAVTSALTFPPVTTGITTNPALFVFGSSSDKPSKPVSPPKFSFTPKTDAFNFSLKPASSVPNIFRLSNSGAFNFPMKSATSIPSVFDNKVVSFLRPREKEPDYEVDSQNEEWVTESESECLGSEHSLERSEDYEDEANSEHIGSSVNNTLTDDIDSSITSVGTLVDQQEGVSLVTKYHSQVHDDSSGDSGETQQQ